MRISGHRIHARMSEANGLYLNILGGDFFIQAVSSVHIDGASRSFKLMLRGSRSNKEENADL